MKYYLLITILIISSISPVKSQNIENHRVAIGDTFLYTCYNNTYLSSNDPIFPASYDRVDSYTLSERSNFTLVITDYKFKTVYGNIIGDLSDQYIILTMDWLVPDNRDVREYKINAAKNKFDENNIDVNGSFEIIDQPDYFGFIAKGNYTFLPPAYGWVVFNVTQIYQLPTGILYNQDEWLKISKTYDNIIFYNDVIEYHVQLLEQTINLYNSSESTVTSTISTSNLSSNGTLENSPRNIAGGYGLSFLNLTLSFVLVINLMKKSNHKKAL